MSNLRKSLRRNFWQNRAEKPPSLASAASHAISKSSVKSPSGKSPPREAVPALIIKCSQEIQKRGLVTEGIFRRSGNTALIEKLLKEFANVDDPLQIDLHAVPIHSLTGLFKRHLQQLSEPVIPKLFQPELLNAYESTPDIEEKIRRIQHACQALPIFHSNLLRFVIQFAHVVSCHADSNKMPAENLSIIFAPTCVRLDGVGQLLSEGGKIKSSPLQTPVKMFRTLSLRKNQSRAPPPRPSLSQATLSCDKLSASRWKPIFSRSQQPQQPNRPMPKYEPRDLLQLGLVKESARWNKFFQFMIENAPKFCTVNEPSKQEVITSSGSSQSLTSLKVRRIKDIFGSMLSMFPDIAEELNITLSPKSPVSDPSVELANAPQPNVTLRPSSSTAALPPRLAITPNTTNAPWSPPIPSLRRTLTIDTSVTTATDESPSRFSGSKYAAIWQHWKEREVEEQQNPAPILTRRHSLRKGGDWLKSISQKSEFATPPINKRPLSMAFMPSARPNYFMR